MSFRVTWKVHFTCTLIAALLAVMLYNYILLILQNYFESWICLYPTGSILINFLIFTLLLMIPVSFIHETIHGIIYTILGGKVIFGFKGIYAYCMEMTGISLSRIEFAIVLMAPVIILSTITSFLPGWVIGLSFILNLLGSSGDILMVLYLFGKPGCRVIDKSYGFDIIKSK